jgi:hypothetical protein
MKFEIYPSGLIRQLITFFFAFGGETSFGRGVIIDFTSNSMEQLCTFSIAKTYT